MRKIFVILMLMLALPIVALADGWILWDKVSFQPEEFAIVVNTPNPYWRLVYAYNSYEVCQEKVVVVAKGEADLLRGRLGMSMQEKKGWSEIKLIEVIEIYVGNYVENWQTKGGQPIVAIIHDFQCFPASFDPRK